MTMRFILISNILIVLAYNIDINHPILYPNSATNADEYLHTRFERSYFGYSVLLHHDSQKNSSWLFIGAPRGNYTRSSRDRMNLKFLNEPGVVYRCGLPGPCVEIEPAFIKDEEIHIRQFHMRGFIRKKQSWFGGAMSIEKNSDFLTICAPRTIMSIILMNNKCVETMQGMCYSDRILSTKLYAEMFEIQHYDYSKDIWFNPIHGFSVAFISSRDEEAITRIVGRPNDDVTGSINVARFKKRSFVETYIQTISINHNLSQFGYAITSGHYFDRNQLLYVCTDPGWDYVGQVAIINPDKNYMVARLWGTDIGEFFGASLATGDFNKDGLHDLVIGAPHWGTENGRVHVYLGSPKEEFEAVAILEGAIEDALFGYAVASGDLDGDGFSDIIVGAPWEESGVIYIYNGDASLKDKVRPLVSQRIAMQSYGPNVPMKIRTFGFSISEPIDVDNNGYVDIAIGAYKSGHVVVLRSKPVVKTNLTIYTVPSTLQRNISDFFITVCVNYHGYDTANTRAFKISLIVDKKYKRTKKTLLELFSREPPVHMCMNTSVTLLDNIQDFIEPIAIYATHDFTYNDSSAVEFCKICPVESKNGKSKNTQTLLLPFDIGCGEDRVCNSNISAIIQFQGVRENNSWVIGSDDITLEIHLANRAEPAYLTSLVFIFPEGIILRSILPFCEEDTDEDNLIVICNIANPLGMNEQRVIKLDLDMKHLTDSSLHGRILEFSMEIRTRSINHGMHIIKAWLTLYSEASLSLNGKTIEESYYLPNLDKDQLNITFQHNYQILKFGATSIDEARLIVNIPAATEDTGSLVFLYKPRIYISGKYYNCLSNGIDLVDMQQNRLQGETASDLYAYNLHNNNETLQNIVHDHFKRDVNDRTTIAARILQMLYSEKTVKSEVLNGNLTVRENDIIYLNCSTYGVSCSTVYCDLSALKTRQDVGKLAMKLILNATKLKDNFKLSDEIKIVKFSTDAYVEIIRPVNRIFNVDARHNINLTTEFRNTAKMQKLQLWVVFVSVSMGLILLYIVIIILSMIGFFKRMNTQVTNEELSALKTNEITEDTNKVEITHIE